MIVNHSYFAQWHLPNSPGNIIWGDFRYEKGEIIELTLKGIFEGEETKNVYYEFIVGQTDYGWITLIDCSGFVGFEETTFTCKSFFIGKGLYQKEHFYFKEAKVSFNTFNEWIFISGFKITHNKENEKYSISYKNPNSIYFNINENIEAYIMFHSDNPSISVDKKITLRQEVYLNLVAKEDNEFHFEEFLKHIYCFQDFITLGTYKTAYPLRINFSKDDREENYDFYTIYDVKHHSQPRSKYDFLFHYETIQNEFSTIITNWFSNYKNLQPVIYLLTDSINDIGVFNENKFLNISHALESFHRRRINNIRRPKAEFDEMIKKIRESVPPEYLTYVNEKYVHGNEPTLHERLNDLITKYEMESFRSVIPDREKFIRDIKNSRNYYTHLDADSEKKALKGYELFILTEKMKMLLYTAILIEFGFSKELTEQILLENSYKRFFKTY